MKERPTIAAIDAGRRARLGRLPRQRAFPSGRAAALHRSFDGIARWPGRVGPLLPAVHTRATGIPDDVLRRRSARAGRRDPARDAAARAAAVEAPYRAATPHPDHSCRDLTGFQPQIVAEAGIAERAAAAETEHRLNAGLDHAELFVREARASSGGAGIQGPSPLRCSGSPQPSQSARRPECVRATETLEGRCRPKAQRIAISCC